MSTHILKTLWSLLFLALGSTAALGKPQPHAKAQQVVAAIKIPTAFQATFSYSHQEKDSPEPPVVITGEVWIKGDQYRLVLNEQILLSDGKTVWNYLPDLNEVRVYDATPRDTPEYFSPVQLLHLYQKGFVPVGLTHRQVDHQGYDIVELQPIADTSFITELTLTVCSKKKIIKNIKTVDQNGILHHFSLLKLTVKKTIADSYFQFSIPAGEEIEVVDLR